MSGDVFISYANADLKVAETLCEALENRSLGCWIASRDIGPGENFQVSIVRAIRAARVMILVFSGTTNNSEEIKKELVLAGQSKLVVIPVRVEDVKPDEAFAYELSTRQWIDLFDDWERAVRRIVRQIETISRTAQNMPSAPAPVTTGASPLVTAPDAPSLASAPSRRDRLARPPAAETTNVAPSPVPHLRVLVALGALAIVCIFAIGLWAISGHAPMLTPAPTSASSPPAAAVNIAGRWRDNLGIVYQIIQDGNEYSYTAVGVSCRGRFESVGHGAITGNLGNSSYTSNYGSTGSCVTTLSSVGMHSQCSDTICGAFEVRLRHD